MSDDLIKSATNLAKRKKREEKRLQKMLKKRKNDEEPKLGDMELNDNCGPG